MEGTSLIIPVFNKIEVTRRCIEHIRSFNVKCSPQIVIIDNGSTDETPHILSKEKDILYIRNKENIGISKAYNMGSKVAKQNLLIFMHNDVFVYEEAWVAKIEDSIAKARNAGIVGLYGAKTIRKDGSFRGKTIVHSKRDAPSITKPIERVAVVDGLLMAIQKKVFEKIGGFNEEFPAHYYDKDISLRSLTHNFFNYVVNIPFEHLSATTRKAIQKDRQIRSEAQKRFIEIWKDVLPVDVSMWREKLRYIFT